jgi:hypothetical protein
VSESGLVAFAVIEDLDVVKDDRAHLRTGLVLDGSVEELDLAFGRRPERLHRGVVVCIAGGAKTRGDVPVPSMSNSVQNQALVGIQRSRRATGNIGVTIRSISGSASKETCSELGGRP